MVPPRHPNPTYESFLPPRYDKVLYAHAVTVDTLDLIDDWMCTVYEPTLVLVC